MAAVGEQPRGSLIAKPHARLIWEFVALFVAAPIAIAVFVNPVYMFATLSAFCLLSVFLIRLTGDYHWKSLVSGWGEVRWGRMAVFCVFVAVAAFLVMAATKPGFMPNVSPERLRLLALLWVLYPLLSALPQEVIFRVLFFHRYGALFGSERSARLTNAAIFSLAHMMYWSPVVAVMTFVGGWIFADVYMKRGFPAAWLIHGLAGNILFAMGMGEFFWSGNVVRPF